jgi:hypothetical protein
MPWIWVEEIDDDVEVKKHGLGVPFQVGLDITSARLRDLLCLAT